MANSIYKANALQLAIEKFITDKATNKDWTVYQTFAQKGIADILQDRAVVDGSIFINFDSVDTMRYEGGSVGTAGSIFTIYFVDTKLNGSSMPERLIETTEEFISALNDYVKQCYFNSYENDIYNGNVCYTTIKIIY